MRARTHDENLLYELAQTLAAGNDHSTAIALRKLVQAGYSTLQQVDGVPDWILLSNRGIGVKRVCGLVELGVDGYLIKEEPMTEYIKAIRAVSSGGTYFSQRVVPIMWGLNSNGSTPTLTPRELEVLELIATGAKADAIAEELFITPRTVTTHATNIYRKLGATNRAAAVRQAIKYGLISV